jgi:hypothetical protein
LEFYRYSLVLESAALTTEHNDGFLGCRGLNYLTAQSRCRVLFGATCIAGAGQATRLFFDGGWLPSATWGWAHYYRRLRLLFFSFSHRARAPLLDRGAFTDRAQNQLQMLVFLQFHPRAEIFAEFPHGHAKPALHAPAPARCPPPCRLRSLRLAAFKSPSVLVAYC